RVAKHAEARVLERCAGCVAADRAGEELDNEIDQGFSHERLRYLAGLRPMHDVAKAPNLEITEPMPSRSIGPRSNVEPVLGRWLARKEPKREARRGEVWGSAPRASDPRADAEEPGKPASVWRLSHRAQSIDWTLVQYRASENDVNDPDLPRRTT